MNLSTLSVLSAIALGSLPVIEPPRKQPLGDLPDKVAIPKYRRPKMARKDNRK